MGGVLPPIFSSLVPGRPWRRRWSSALSQFSRSSENLSQMEGNSVASVCLGRCSLDGGGDAAQAPEMVEVPGAGQARVAQVLPPGERSESVRVRFSYHVVREGPVPAGGHGPVRVGNVEGVAELDDACIFHAAAVRPVCAGAEYRLVAGALEMESVGAGGQPEPDHMVLVVACRPVQHVEYAVVQDDARVAYDQILPRMGGMR